MTPRQLSNAVRKNQSPFESLAIGDREVVDGPMFRRMLALERRRTERNKQPFLLMLLDAGELATATKTAALGSMARSLLGYCRDTDIVGWYKDGSSIGVIFTGLEIEDKNTTIGIFMNRVTKVLCNEPTFGQLSQMSMSFHIFPDDWEPNDKGKPNNTVLYPDLENPDKAKRPMLVVKRTIDVVGSLMALIALAPVMLVIALAVKLTSKGDILFRQQRVGQHGQCFTFLKFRSMYTGNDNRVHQAFVKQLIADQNKGEAPEGEQAVYKIKNDSRITPLGRFLRKSSLDELPQFWNVLRGEMSLVGPRPPIPYELAAYQTWHRRRVLEAKPGITGLWQVIGRSRVRFDDMVRLDLQYTATWTPWLDLKILLRTPLAVFKGAM